MERLVKGDVIVLPFPFSDLSASKRRPALVVSEGEYGDFILCQITSKMKRAADAIEIKDKDFSGGRLRITIYIRPKKLFTADSGIILYKIGSIKKEKTREVEDCICKTVKS